MLVRTARVNGLLGTDLTGADVERLLTPIGFEVAVGSPGRAGAGDQAGGDAVELDVTVPSCRPDTSTEVDVIEEVARHHGYSNIPRSMPPSVRAGALSPRQLDRRLVRQVMVGLGLDEAMPLPFLAPDDLVRAGLDEGGIGLTNPLAAEESVLRTSLRPGLLRSVAYNESHRTQGVGLFEIGKVFGRPEVGQQLPDEREVLAAALAGCDARAAVESWHTLAGALGVQGVDLRQGTLAGMHPVRAAELVVDGAVLGVVGEIDPGVLEGLGIVERVAWLEVDLDQLLALPHGTAAYAPVSRYPSSDIDLAFVVPDAVPAAQVRDTIREAAGELLADLALFDVFRSDSLGAAARSLAFTLRLQADDRTLTDDEVGQVRTRVIDAVSTIEGTSLRA